MTEASGGATTPAAAELPALVRRYLDRALPSGPAVPQQVRITQEGRMRQKPDGRELRFTAVEELAVRRVAFSWRARFGFGPLALRVVDAYADGNGLLEGRLLGVRVLRQTGPETALGEALRYLAELPWVPQAMAHNRELEWRAVDERHVEVAAHVAGTRLAFTFTFDDQGDLVSGSSPMRPYRAAKRLVETPWGGSFGEYAVLDGVRVPKTGAVHRDLPTGRFVYWRGTVTRLELLDTPFTGGRAS